MKLKHFILALVAMLSGFAFTANAQVAKVGNTEYATINEAIAAWGNNTTLTLLADVTLSDVVKLKSTEHHILNLGTYTMTAASGNHAIEITCEGRSSASYALTVNADAANPGGITATGKSCIYYKKSGSTKDRPIILINNGVFTGSYSINSTSNGNTNCPQIWINGGIFNSYMNLTKNMLKISGGTFHAAINATGDSSAYREIKGGRFKSWQFMTADAANKFWVGSGNGNYNVGVYVDKEGYLVVGGPVITEVSAKYPAVASNYSKWSSYLKYSSAATYGLFYEDAAMAIAKHGIANVTIWTKPAVTIPETLTGDVVEEIKNNTALKDYTPENLPAGAELEIELKSVGETFVYDVTPMANGAEVEPTQAITFRLPVPASVTKAYANVYHEGTLMGIYAIQGEGNAKYVEVSSADFSVYTVEPTTVAAKIGETGYATFAEALAAAKAMTGDVTVEIYEKVTLNGPLTGSYSSIKFVGQAEAAEIYLDIQGYSEAAGKKVAFENLKLSKVAGGYITNAGFMNLAFGIYGATETTYTNCTFLNGAYASSGVVTFTGCTFYRSHDRYGLWAYGDVDAIVDGCKFADIRGIKMYAEGQGAEGSAVLTVKNTDFTAADNKPAIVLTYGESVTLEGNIYSSTGTFELDLDGKPNGVAVTSDVAPVCVNDNGACGVLVDGKIYTTVAQAAAVATSGSNVTLLHSSDETVEFPMGTTIEKNGFTADNVSTAQPFAEYVVLPISMTVNNYKALFGTNTVTDGTNYYATLQAAVEEVAGQANKVLYCKPGADVGSLQHAPVTSTLTVYGNGANVTGGAERDFDLGNTDPNGGRDITADMTLTVKYLNGCGAWGAKATEHTVNLVFENCANMGKVFITGSTGTLNITMTDCAFEGVIKEAVYSNADGAITLNNVAFSNLNKAINLNHKDVGTQTVTINGCSFTNCGADVAADQIPVRVLSSVEGGKSVLAVSNSTFTGTPAGGADILLDYGVGTTEATVASTTANVVVEKENNVGTKTEVSAGNSYEFTNAKPVAMIGDAEYATLEEAAAAAKAGDVITLNTDATLSAELTLPAGITLNGNGQQINGNIVAAGNLTFAGHTKVTSFNAGYNKPTITIGEGACLEMNGTGRMVIGHGATFNITGTITDAKTANVADLTPSLIMAGASFTGAGVTFNVTNAYIKAPSSYCSSSKSASGTFDFNITNSIWENAGKLAFEAQSTAATVNFDLVESVLTTGSHLVFGVSRGKVVIDNSNVNVGKSNQIENQSTMIVKNGAVVNGSVATSSNAKNPGTLTVDNATYNVTGEFSGSDLGTGTLIIKKGANVSAGSITKANIQVDATGMVAGDAINLTANLSKLAGTLEVINNDKLEAKIVDGKVVLAAKPVAKIGDTGYATLAEAVAAVQEGETITILAGTISEGTIKLPATLKNVTFKGESVARSTEGAILKDMTISAADGNSYSYIGLTFDGITFDNSRLLFTGWRNGEEVIENLTVTNCTFKNLYDTTNNAAIHINKDAAEAVNGFTFTNNVIDGATGGSKSGIYAQVTGEVIITGNTFNNIVFRPALIQLADCDGVGDNVVISNNSISNTTRLQVYGTEEGPDQGPWTPAGTDDLSIAINRNIFQNITGQYICTWGINGETDITKNYYDSEDLGGKIYWNNESPADEAGLNAIGVYPIYTELNEDGTINTESEYTPVLPVAEVNGVKYETLTAAVAAAQAGDEIVLLSDVVLDGGITVENKALTLDGNGYSIAPAGDGKLGYQAVYFYGGANATYTIKNVTFKNFVQSNVDGPILRLESADQFNLVNVTFVDCDVAKNDKTTNSIIRVYNTDFEADNLTITNCKGGMMMDIGPSSDSFVGNIVIKNSKFEGNTAIGTALIYPTLKKEENSLLTISNTEFNNNVIGDANATTPQGRGVIHLGSNSNISSCVFDGNAVYGSHASNVVYGINEYSGYEHTFANNTFMNSAAYQTNATVGPVSGAAIMAVGTAVLEDNIVENNNKFYHRASADAQYEEKEVRSVGSYSTSYGLTTIESGTYYGALASYGEGKTFNVSGGTFSTEVPAVYCADGFVCQLGDNGLYGIVVAPVVMMGENGYQSVKEALAAAQAAGLENVVITIVGENTAATADEFDLVYATAFDKVTFKQANDGKAYYFDGLYTGKRNNGGQFVFDGVKLVVTGQYMFEGNVVLSNNSLIKSTAEANCFVYYAEVTVEAGSKIEGVIEDIRGGSLIIDGGKTDGTYSETPGLRDAILVVNWTDSKLVLKNGAYVKVNAADEVGRLTVNGKMDVSNSKLESYQWIAVNQGATFTLNTGSVITTKELTGAGTIYVDARGVEEAVTVINANMSGFTGTITVEGGDYEITNEGLVITKSSVAKIGETKYATLEAAFKAATSGCTIEILSDVTVSDAWDCRYTGSKFTVPVTINGNGKTIKFTGAIDDKNWNTVFRFEADATVNNLTVDISEATSVQRVISAKKSLTVDGLTIIGAAKYGVIFGEGAGAEDLAAAEIVVKNSTLTGTRRAVSDNEGGKDVKSVTIVDNTFAANVYVSASNNVTFTGNTVSGAYVDIRSYTANNSLNVTATGNTLTPNGDVESQMNKIKAGGNIEAQNEFVVPAKGSVTPAFAGTTTIWGEGGGNAKQSLVVALYSNETLLATASLNNIGGILNGNVYVTWNIPLNNAGNDAYWDVEWSNYVTAETMPTKVVMVIDGVEVAENNFQLNSPDDLNKIYAAVADAEGKFTQFCTTLAEAVAAAQAGETVVILKDVEVASGSTITLDGVNVATLDGVTLTNNGAFQVKGEVSLNIATLAGSESIDFLDGATIKNSTIGGNVFVAGNVTFRGANTFAMLYDYGTLTDYYGTTAPMKWTVEEGASVTLTTAARYGLGYGDDVTVYGNIENALTARENLTEADLSLFMHGLVAQESKGWNCDSKFTVENAYVAIGSNNSFGNKPGNYGGTYTFNIKNSVVDASRITFYEALSTTTFTIENSDVKMGTFMTRDADSKFTLKNSKVLSTTTSNGTDEGNYNKGELTLENSKLTYSAELKHEAAGVINLDINSLLTAPKLSGAGAINVNATGISVNVTVIEADMSDFSGTITVEGGNFEITSEGLVIKEKTLAGAGTEENPYLISNVEELVFFRDKVNSGDTKYNTPGVWVALAADIDLAGTTWTEGIGDGHNWSFDGNFDGKNHTIKNLTVAPYADGNKYLCGGLFGYIYGGATIKNLVIENATIDCGEAEGHNVGVLVGFANNNGGKANISNITVKGDVKVNAPNAYGVGAIVGYSYREMGTIENCTVEANAGSYIKGHSFVGGITGYSYTGATITGCSVKNLAITATKYSVGGIAGITGANNIVSYCAVENVTVAGEANVGNIVGAISADGLVVENCTAAEPLVGGNYSDNKPVEARIGNKYYATLTAALVAEGNEVELLVPVTVAKGETRVIDLNGKTVTGVDNATGSYAMITNQGDLTITGNGKITLTATNNRGWSAYSSVISNTVGGKLTVENGTIEHLGGTDMAYAIDNLTNGKGTYAETVINGGTIKSTYRAIRQFLNGVEAQNILTVKGGTIEGANKSIWFQDPSANANSGTLTVTEDATLNGDVYLFVTAGSTKWPVEVAIADAAFAEGKTVVTGNVPTNYEVVLYDGVHSVEYGIIDELNIVDDGQLEEFVNRSNKTVGKLTYERDMSDYVDKWQPLYVPFEIPVKELTDLGYQVAIFYDVHFELAGDGTIDPNSAPDLHILKITSGTLKANYPYVIKPSSANPQLSIELTDAKLYSTAKSEMTSVESGSTITRFIFAGTYTKATPAGLIGNESTPCYAITKNGTFKKMGAAANLPAFRVYMSIVAKDGSHVILADNVAESIRMRVIGEEAEDGTTIIYDVEMDDKQLVDYIYDLQGRRILEPQKGNLYIINGKKVIF